MFEARRAAVLLTAAVAYGIFTMSAVTAAPSYDGSDGHRYVLQTGLLSDMRTWQDAQSFCNGVSMGGKLSLLSPYRDQPQGDSKRAIYELCVANGKTCWLNEGTHEGAPGEKLCPLVTAKDEVVWQACNQLVSFVCRSADAVVTPGAPPPPSPAKPSPPPSGDRSGDTASVPLGAAKQKSFKGLDGRTYTLFFLGAVRSYNDSKSYCQSAGLELSPYNVDTLYGGDSVFSVKLLCSYSTSTTCWLGEGPVGGLCPMLDQAGDMHYQGCSEELAFVCRTQQPESQPQDPGAQQPSGEQVAPEVTDSWLAEDGRYYTLYSGSITARRSYQGAADHCASLGQELSPYGGVMPSAGAEGVTAETLKGDDSVNALNRLCRGRYLTCWMGPGPKEGLCPIYSGPDDKAYLQGCKQPVSWVCRTAAPVAYPDLNGDGPLPTDPVPALPAEPAATVQVTGRDGLVYTLYRGDAPNRRKYAGAVAFCESLGQELSPYNRRRPDGDSVAAVRWLVGGARTTSWVRERVVGAEFCPLVSQDVVATWQSCDQEINFVCRTKPVHKRR